MPTGAPPESWTDTFSGLVVPTGGAMPDRTYNVYLGGGTTITEGNGYLNFTLANTVGYATLEGRWSGTLVGSACTIQMPYATPTVTAAVNSEIYPLRIYRFDDTTYQVWFLITGGLISAYQTVASTNTQLTSTTFNAATMKWFRIRENSGTTYWEYSADGVSWTVLWSKLNVFVMDYVLLNISVGSYTTVTPGIVLFDNLNLPPRLDTWKRVQRPHPFQPGVTR